MFTVYFLIWLYDIAGSMDGVFTATTAILAGLLMVFTGLLTKGLHSDKGNMEKVEWWEEYKDGLLSLVKHLKRGVNVLITVTFISFIIPSQEAIKLMAAVYIGDSVVTAIAESETFDAAATTLNDWLANSDAQDVTKVIETADKVAGVVENVQNKED